MTVPIRYTGLEFPSISNPLFCRANAFVGAKAESVPTSGWVLALLGLAR